MHALKAAHQLTLGRPTLARVAIAASLSLAAGLCGSSLMQIVDGSNLGSPRKGMAQLLSSGALLICARIVGRYKPHPPPTESCDDDFNLGDVSEAATRALRDLPPDMWKHLEYVSVELYGEADRRIDGLVEDDSGSWEGHTIVICAEDLLEGARRAGDIEGLVVGALRDAMKTFRNLT